jgi:tetratricopeptide (TPR) repeat protein
MPFPTEPDRAAQSRRDLDVEISFLEGVIRRDPNYVEALQILGDAYTKRGDYERGLEIDRRLAALCPNDSLVLYNLACSLALTHQKDEAFRALERAIALGYRDVRWLQRDDDLKPLRDDPRFEKLIQKLSAKKGY